MPQVQLPIFPPGVTHINSEVAFEERDGKVYYFNGHLPVFVHEKSALATFRLFSTQLVINGNATQAEISRAFGVPLYAGRVGTGFSDKAVVKPCSIILLASRESG